MKTKILATLLFAFLAQAGFAQVKEVEKDSHAFKEYEANLAHLLTDIYELQNKGIITLVDCRVAIGGPDNNSYSISSLKSLGARATFKLQKSQGSKSTLTISEIPNVNHKDLVLFEYPTSGAFNTELSLRSPTKSFLEITQTIDGEITKITFGNQLQEAFRQSDGKIAFKPWAITKKATCKFAN